MKKILLHIGMPKTASTVFQKYIFKNSKLNFLNDDLLVDKKLNFVKKDLVKISEGVDIILSKKKKLILQKYVKNCEHGVIFSHEGVSSYLSLSEKTLETKINLFKDYFNFYFCEYYIFLILRRPSDWFSSIYKQRVKRGYYNSFEYFLDKNLKKNKDYFNNYVDLSKTNIFFAYQTFLKNNKCKKVYLKFYENINKTKYFDDMNSFFKMKNYRYKLENISIDNKHLTTYRYINKFYIAILLFLKYFLPDQYIKFFHQKINRFIYKTYIFIFRVNSKNKIITKKFKKDLEYLDKIYNKFFKYENT